MKHTKLGLSVLGAALCLGVLGSLLLRATPWGVNAPIWIAALVLSTVVLGRLGTVGLGNGGWWLAPLAVLFASFVAWRAAPMLIFLNVSMVLVVLSLGAIRGRQGSLKSSGIFEYVLGGLYTGLCAIAGPIPTVTQDVEWREVAQGRWQSALAVTRGVLISIPLLLIFGSLFVAADAVFKGLVRDTFDFTLDEVFDHLLLAGFLAWVCAGFLRLVFLGREPGWISPGRPTSFSLGSVEIGIALGLLNVLFLAFAVVQVRYLFGGLGEISASGLTYAEYARRGFFELAAVTALVLPLLLLSHWLFRPGTALARSFQSPRRFSSGTAPGDHGLGLLPDVAVSSGFRPYGTTVLYGRLHGLARRRTLVVCSNGAPARPAQPLRLRRPPIWLRRDNTPQRRKPRLNHRPRQRKPHARRRALRSLLPDHSQYRRRARAGSRPA